MSSPIMGKNLLKIVRENFESSPRKESLECGNIVFKTETERQRLIAGLEKLKEDGTIKRYKLSKSDKHSELTYSIYITSI